MIVTAMATPTRHHLTAAEIVFVDGGDHLHHPACHPFLRTRVEGVVFPFGIVGGVTVVAGLGGTFVGGFYSRATNRGCDARVEVHDYGYYDYSLGTRCCKSL